MGAMLNLEIPLPPLPEQRRIAAILNDQLAAVDRARAAAQAQLDEIDRLPEAIMRQAFRGEL
jgi:type I restriction enzyme S subunit